MPYRIDIIATTDTLFTKMDTLARLTSLIIAQGIVSQPAIRVETDLKQDLQYKQEDIEELLRMTQKEFKLSLNLPEEYTEISQIDHLIAYIHQSQEKHYQ